MRISWSSCAAALVCVVTLVGSVIHGNLPDRWDDLVDLNATYCNLEDYGGVPGEFGNFGSAPGFVDAESGDYRLTAVSANIDRGSDQLCPDNDLLGLPRVEVADLGTPGPSCDVGAYEYQP